MKDITDTVNDVCTTLTVAMLPNYNYICTVHTVGYCLYGTLLLHPRSACPVQMRAHHHIDVFTDINHLL